MPTCRALEPSDEKVNFKILSLRVAFVNGTGRGNSSRRGSILKNRDVVEVKLFATCDTEDTISMLLES